MACEQGSAAGKAVEGAPPFDAEGFADALRAARDASRPSEEEEVRHLGRMEIWTFLLALAGVALAIRGVVSPLAMLMLGYYKYAKFAILAHHSLHGGWGRTRRGWFAQGLYRRVVDWLDWIFPMAWIVEHNKVHHYRLNEDADPDFVERNTKVVQDMDIPLAAKYAVVAVQAATWKWFYYASNTLKLLHADRPSAPSKEEMDEPIVLTHLLREAVKGNPWYRALAADFFLRVAGPPLLLHFVALPVAAGLVFGRFVGPVPLCWSALLNMVGAELVTNVHAFVTIVTNHAGSDLWWFDRACKADTAEFYLRAILGSTAYTAGSDIVDYWHGFLNYQGEHHAFPDLSPLHYQRLHPRFKEVCASFGVPYVQENVLVRTKKTVDVIVGVAKHKRLQGQAVDHPQAWMCGKSHKD